jgi:luciferase family oxidoreductase group 1
MSFEAGRKLKLSVLDQSVAVAGRSHVSSIQNTLALAQACEAWGYHRFWVSEHHSHPTIVGTAPEVLMAAIAARTQRIRIGSAGVMLPHYAPLKVAEQFCVLNALAPGRIDLGVGRAPGSDQRTAHLLNPHARGGAQDFPQQVQALQSWVQGQPLYGVQAYPLTIQSFGADAEDIVPTTVQAMPPPAAPALWILGSSDYGAQLAAALGLPYAFAAFITDGEGAAEALQLYRERYQPSAAHPTPKALLCVWALAADTEAKAWHLFKSRERARMDRNLGLNAALVSPEHAARDWSVQEQVALARLRQMALVGTGPQVAAKLHALASAHGVDELAVITWTHDAQAQARSYELLSQAI